MRLMYQQPRNIKLPHAAELRRLVALNWGINDLAREYGVTPNRVKDRLQELDLAAPVTGAPRKADPSHFPSYFMHRQSGTVSVSFNSMHVAAIEERRV